MRRRILSVLAAAFLAAGLSAAGTVAARTADVSPAVEICNNNGSSSLCMNRKGGGRTDGTSVIGYSAGNVNNDFEYIRLSGKCNNGQVEVLPGGGCPFPSGSGLNSKYNGWYINAVESISDTNYCVGSQENSSGAILTPCPDANGNNGGWGTVLITCPSQDNCPIVDLHWTIADAAYAAGEGPCAFTRSNQILMSYNLSSITGQCKWTELFG